jgi:glycosyl transferase family 2
MTMLIVIPVHDEAATIAGVVAEARRHGPVLVVDDGSKDDGAVRAAAAGAEVLRHPRRLGKAQALRTGVAAARARGASVVVTLDGDGQHDPADVPALLAAAAPRTLVIGRRCDDRGTLAVERVNAIRLAGFFMNWAGGARVLDTQSGFRLYPLALFDDLRLRRGGFVFESEVLLAALARGWRVVEVDITAQPRTGERSRFRPVRDGAAIGAFIAGRVLRRWVGESGAAAGAVGGIVRRERFRARHAAMFEGAAPYADSPPLWGWAVGAVAVNRLVARLGHWWQHPRRRRAVAAAGATAVAPLTVGLLVAQAIVGRRMPDVVTPLVAALYSQDRLDAPQAPATDATPVPDGLAVESRS